MRIPLIESLLLRHLSKLALLSAARGVGEFPTLVAGLVVGSDRALHSILIEAIGAYYSGNVRAIEAFLVGYLTAVLASDYFSQI